MLLLNEATQYRHKRLPCQRNDPTLAVKIQYLLRDKAPSSGTIKSYLALPPEDVPVEFVSKLGIRLHLGYVTLLNSPWGVGDVDLAEGGYGAIYKELKDGRKVESVRNRLKRSGFKGSMWREGDTEAIIPQPRVWVTRRVSAVQSLASMAKELGITPLTLSKYLRGEGRMTMGEAYKLAKMFKSDGLMFSDEYERFVAQEGEEE